MQLSDAITQYMADRKAKGIKATTLRGERITLNYLLSDIGNVSVTSMSHRHLDLFWSKRTTWGQGSMNKARYQLTSFIQWCEARGYMRPGQNLLHGTRNLKVPPRPRVTIPQDEFTTFLEGISQPRTRAMCAIGLYLFCRLSEIRALRWQDVLLTNKKVVVQRLKTSQIESLPLCDELEHELRRWAREYATIIGRPLRPEDFVIPYATPGRYVGVKGVKGKLVPTTALEYQPDKPAPLAHPITKALKQAGYYQPHEGGHTLRRSGAIALYNSLAERGHDKAMRIVQWMLGHSSIQTTEIYLRLSLESKAASDLLAGQPMFPARKEAEVIQLRETK